MHLGTKKIGLIGLAAMLAAAPAASAADDVSLRLHWLVNGTTIAWYLGAERGYFEDAGINLTINEGKGSVIATQVVGSGSEQFGTADAVPIIQSASKGVPIKAIMALQDVGALGVIVLKDSGITSLKDLEGKRLGLTAGDSLTQQWPVVAEVNELDQEAIDLIYMDPASKPVALMGGQVDAMLGTCIDHVIVVESRGQDAECLSFAQNGVPTVGISVFANEEVIENNPDLVERFVGAAVKSYEAFYEDPEAAVDAAIKARPDIDRETIAAQAKIIKDLYGDQEVGAFSDNNWENTVETMKKTGSLTSDRPFDTYYTAQFVNP